MKTEQSRYVQSTANEYRFSKYKYSYIYYAHPIALYNTEQEKIDIQFLKIIGKVLNPADINKQGVSVFINFTLYAKEVWFRGYTAGVCLEVIVARLKHIPVYSLETKLPISVEEQRRIIDTYNKTSFVESDISLLSSTFSKPFVNRFCNYIDGDYP